MLTLNQLTMEPKFLIKEVKEGVEVLFTTSNGRKIFKSAKFADIDAAKDCINKLKRRCESKYFILSEVDGKHYFTVRDREDNLLCRSKDYTSRHRAKEGIVIALRDIPGAKKYTETELD